MSLRSEIASDTARFDASAWKTLIQQPQHRWLAAYRIADCSVGWRRSVLGFMVMRYGRRFGYTIPLGTIGPALRLPHAGTIVINGAARVGRNCQIYQGVTIGGDRHGAPTIGDDVFIGPNVTIIGAVEIGDGAVLAAGVNIRSDVHAGAVRAPVDDAVRLASRNL